jgi:hypothetical protein
MDHDLAVPHAAVGAGLRHPLDQKPFGPEQDWPIVVIRHE